MITPKPCRATYVARPLREPFARIELIRHGARTAPRRTPRFCRASRELSGPQRRFRPILRRWAAASKKRLQLSMAPSGVHVGRGVVVVLSSPSWSLPASAARYAGPPGAPMSRARRRTLDSTDIGRTLARLAPDPSTSWAGTVGPSFEGLVGRHAASHTRTYQVHSAETAGTVRSNVCGSYGRMGVPGGRRGARSTLGHLVRSMAASAPHAPSHGIDYRDT